MCHLRKGNVLKVQQAPMCELLVLDTQSPKECLHSVVTRSQTHSSFMVHEQADQQILIVIGSLSMSKALDGEMLPMHGALWQPGLCLLRVRCTWMWGIFMNFYRISSRAIGPSIHNQPQRFAIVLQVAEKICPGSALWMKEREPSNKLAVRTVANNHPQTTLGLFVPCGWRYC